MHIEDQETAKAMWYLIKTWHLGATRVREACLQTMMTNFDTMRMLIPLIRQVIEYCPEIRALGDVLDKTRLEKEFLKSLSISKYIHIVSSFEQALDLNKAGFEDVVGRLQAYEEQIREDDMQRSDQGKLLFSNSNSNNHVSLNLAWDEDMEAEVVIETDRMDKAWLLVLMW